MKELVSYEKLTRSIGGRGWITFGQIYLGFGKIYVNACSGGDAGESYNNFALYPEDVSIGIYKVNSDGSKVRVYSWSSSPFDSCDTNLIPAADRKEVEFTKAEGIEPGNHTYRIEMRGEDTHDGVHYATIEGIPAPPPIPGPIVTVRNKTGHFHSTGPVTLEFAAYTNGGTEVEPAAIQLVIDGTGKVITTFPHEEVISGVGSHSVSAVGVDADDNRSKPIVYNFIITQNDWSADLLTPIKTIRYSGTENGFVNFYTKNADLESLKFTDIFGGTNVCYANANTAEISSFDFDVARASEQTTDSANTYAQVLYLTNPGTTALSFDHVVNQPTATDMEYLETMRTVDHEVGVFICSYENVSVQDECTIPKVIKEFCELSTLPNANSVYEFGISGLIGRFEAKKIKTHPINQQYYHIHYQPSDRREYGKLFDNYILDVNISPEETDTKITIDLFNACGDKHSKTFDIKFVSGGAGVGTIGGGGASLGQKETITPVISIAATPNYHNLIVKR
jgi:hypothetical protein